MANRRMFSKDITTSDAFVDMPISSRLLYFHLGMEADDDGFIGNAKMLSRAYGVNNEDLKTLEEKGFVIIFSSGVTVIKDWKINNQIRADRRKETMYKEDLKLLSVDANGSYFIDNQLATNSQPNVNHTSTKCQPNDNQTGDNLATQYSIGQDSIEQDRLGQCSLEQDRSVKGSKGEGSIEQSQEQSRATHSFDACCSLYEKNFHKLTTLDKNSLSRLEEASGSNFLYIAIEKTIYKEDVANPLGYITKLIQDWLSNGFTSIDDIEDEQQVFNAQYE